MLFSLFIVSSNSTYDDHTRFHSLSGGGPFCIVETLFSIYRSFLLDLLCCSSGCRGTFAPLIIYYMYSCSLQVALRRVSQT